MALRTLAGLKELNGYEVADCATNFGGHRPLLIHEKSNQIAFKLQQGPVKEAGKNGCQVSEIIAVAKMIIEGLNKDFPCRENAMTITKLDEALMWQEKRTKDRIARNVEGFNQQ